MNFLVVVLLLFFCLISLSQSQQSQIQKQKYGFFFQTYMQPVAAKLVFLRLREVYPLSPVYIYADNGGVDLSGLCTGDVKCRFEEASVHNGHEFQTAASPLEPKSLAQARSFFMSFRNAAEWGQCEYLVYVEEDIWLRGPITARYGPKGDTGGIYNKWYPSFTKKLSEYVYRKTGTEMAVKTVIYAASYYRSAALIDAMDNHWDKVNWTRINELDRRVPLAWDTVPPILFALAGYKAAYWNAACEKSIPYDRKFRPLRCKNSPLQHKFKNPASLAYIGREHNFNATLARMGGRVTRGHLNDKCFQNMTANYLLPCPLAH